MQAPVYACAPTATLAMAARAMEAHNVGSLVVTDDEAHIVGIITDRDLALCLGHGHDGAMAAAEAMSPNVVSIPNDADVHDAAAAMDSHRGRRLPVADAEGRPIGVICLDDLYNYLTQDAITLYGAVRAQGAPQA
jgi:CBS domain-containing protein